MPKDAATETSTNPYRLPRTVVPVRYEVTLEPDLAAGTFVGEVTAAIDVREPTNTIVLNAIELEIDEAWVDNPAGADASTPITSSSTRRASGLTITLSELVPAGAQRLHVRFRGVLNDKLKGFYRSTFVDTAGEQQVIATTQFESTDAASGVPVLGRAGFQGHLRGHAGRRRRPGGDLQFAEEIGRRQVGDGKVCQFADTMKMSTYLVAFIVGRFEATTHGG